MIVGLVVLVGAPWLGDGEILIVGGGSAEKSGREAYTLLKCIYILFFVLSLPLQCFPLLVTFFHVSFLSGSRPGFSVFSKLLPESSDPL